MQQIESLTTKDTELEGRVRVLETQSGTIDPEISEKITKLEGYFSEDGKANSSLDSDKLGGKDPSYYASTEQLNSVINGITWKNPVLNITKLKEINSPQEGWTVSIEDTNKIYRFDTSTEIESDSDDETKIKANDGTTGSWLLLGTVVYNKATQEQDGLMSKEDKTTVDNLGSTYLSLAGGEITGNLECTQKIISSEIYSETVYQTFNTLQELKESKSLKEGYYCKTKGFYEAGDGGNSEYIVIGSNEELEDDGYTIIKLNSQEQDHAIVGISVVGESKVATYSYLYLKLIIRNEVNVKWFGAYGDGIHDDTEALQNTINFAQKKNTEPIQISVFIPRGDYIISKALDINITKISIIGDSVTVLVKQNDLIAHIRGFDVDDTKKRFRNRTISDIQFRPFDTSSQDNRIEIGFKIGTEQMSDNRPARNVLFKNVGFLRCNKCFYINNNAYLMQWEGCGSAEHEYFIYSPLIQGNSGENMVMRDCLVTYGKKVDIYIAQPNMQFRIHNTSFDAGADLIYINAPVASLNMISFIDCHFEPANVGQESFATATGNCCYINFVRCSFYNRQSNIKYWFNCPDNANGYINLYDCYMDTENTTSRYYSNGKQNRSKNLRHNKQFMLFNKYGNIFGTNSGDYFIFGKDKFFNSNNPSEEIEEQVIISRSAVNVSICGELDTIYGISQDTDSFYNIGCYSKNNAIRAQYDTKNFLLSIEDVEITSTNDEFPTFPKELPNSFKVVSMKRKDDSENDTNSIAFNVLAKNDSNIGGYFSGMFYVSVENPPITDTKVYVYITYISQGNINPNLAKLNRSFNLKDLVENKLSEQYFMDIYAGIPDGCRWIGWQFRINNMPKNTKLFIIQPQLFRI